MAYIILIFIFVLLRDFLGKEEEVTIRCGEWDLRSDQEWFAHQDRKVDSFSIHFRYRGGDKLYNDIALIHVKKDFDLADIDIEENLNVVPICLPKVYGRDFLQTRDDCVSMGWGKKSSDANEYEVSMKQVKLPMVANNECQAALRSKTRLFSTWRLDQSFVCAGGMKGEDTCDGDGGGPLVCRSKDDPNR